MAHGLVEQDAGSAGAHHHGHLPALGPPGGEPFVDACNRLGRDLLQQGVAEHLDPAPVASRNGLVLGLPSLLEDHGRRDAPHWARVVLEFPESIVHQDVADLEGQHGDDLDDAAVAAPDAFLQALEEGEEVGGRRAPPMPPDRIAVRGGIGLAPDGPPGRPVARPRAGPVGNGRRGPRCGQHVRDGRALGVGIAGLFPVQHADPDAEVDMFPAGGHFAVPEGQVAVGRVLEIEVGIVAPAGETLRDEAVQCRAVNLEDAEIRLFRLDHTLSFLSGGTVRDHG